jgi:hypothetical protein
MDFETRLFKVQTANPSRLELFQGLATRLVSDFRDSTRFKFWHGDERSGGLNLRRDSGGQKKAGAANANTVNFLRRAVLYLELHEVSYA